MVSIVRIDFAASMTRSAPLAVSQLSRGMFAIPGGIFIMGARNFYPEEAPARRIGGDPFPIDETPARKH